MKKCFNCNREGQAGKLALYRLQGTNVYDGGHICNECLEAYYQSLPPQPDLFADPRTPEEIRAEIATYQPGYVWRNPFTGEPLK